MPILNAFPKGLLAAVLLLLLSGTAHAQLNGIYTIGGAIPDYATITDAVADLNSLGTSGSVTFHIRAGTYDEQVTINDFTRTGSPTDRVIFTREFSHITVTWQYSAATAATNWVVQLNGASYITLQGISFEAAAPSPTGRLIVFDNEATYNTLRNNTLQGLFAATSITGSLVSVEGGGNYVGNTFETNTFTWGHRGIDWSAFENSHDMVVFGNTFGGQYDAGLYLQGTKYAKVDSNIVSSAAWSDTAYRGIYVRGFLVPGPSVEITRNTVDIAIGNTGIWLYGEGGALNEKNLIANNLVALRDATNGSFGLRLEASTVEVYHNTVRTTRSTGSVLYARSFFPTTGHLIKNNLFSADGGGLAMDIGEDHNSYEADYNNLYTTGATLVEVDGTSYATLTAYRDGEAGPDDEHSTAVSVTFVNVSGTNDLHLAAPSNNSVALLAPQVGGITTDIDDDARSIYSVYKGADEGTQILPMDNADTASGFYTVGGTTPDYPNVNNAIFTLNQRGIKGAVTFRVRGGTYDTHVNLAFARFPAPSGQAKTGEDPLVRFRAANEANRPTLQHTAAGMADNWVLRLEDAHSVSFQKLNFEANGAAPYGRIIDLDGEAVQNITFDDCTFTGITGETGTAAALVWGFDFEQHNLTFLNNTFNDGSYGLYLGQLGGAGTRGTETLIEGNTFTEQLTAGVEIAHQVILLRNNTVTSAQTNTIGFHVISGEAGSVFDREIIVGNQIHLTGTNCTGLLLDESHGFTTGKAQMKNNIVNARHIAVEFTGNSRLYKIFHNTFRARDLTLYIPDAGAGIEILNNILVNTFTNEALYVADGADIDFTDYNDITNDGGGTLVHWNGIDHATLASYKTVSGQDAHSVNAAVTFVDQSNGDLHLTGASDGDPDLAGIPLTDVTIDIDGDARALGAPYKGADEAATLLGFALTVDALLDGPYNTGTPGTLLTGLNDNDLIPFDQPYNTTPWNYAGTETIDAFFLANNSDVVDWVYLQILSGDPLSPPMTLEAEAVGLVRDDGRVVQQTVGLLTTDQISVALTPGAYYVALGHRNHLSVMSATAVDFSAGAGAYNFTDALSKAYTAGGTAMRDRGDGFFTLWGGDGDANGSVSAFDFLNEWLPINGAPPGYDGGDFDMNGSGTAFDFLTVWLPANGQASQVP